MEGTALLNPDPGRHPALTRPPGGVVPFQTDRHIAPLPENDVRPRALLLWSRVGFRACWQQAGAICSTLLTFWKNSGEFRPGNHQSLELLEKWCIFGFCGVQEKPPGVM